MRFLVDEMPKSTAECIFGRFDKLWYRWRCKFGDYVPKDCPKTCSYLVKGVAVNELAGEDDGEKETGEAAEPNMA